MKYLVSFLLMVPSILAFNYTKKKFNYIPGVICNYDILPTITEQVVVRYFCVPLSICRSNSVARKPAMPQMDGYCDEYLTPPPSHEPLICCHTKDITDENTVNWSWTKAYVPGLRSWLACRDHAQALCISGADISHCSMDRTRPGPLFKPIPPNPIKGAPSAIHKYPHSALIGYKKDLEWNWFCTGSIISVKFILTAGKCSENPNETNLFVKVGESRLCSTCPDGPEEQVIRVENVVSKKNDRYYYQDFALMELAKDIKFNPLVRPACLLTDYSIRQTQGWFAKYGREQQTIETPKAETPEFFSYDHLTHKDRTLSFRVKADEEVFIYFSNKHTPEEKGSLEVVLGASENTKSYIRSDSEKTIVNTSIIINGFEYRGFWIQLFDNYVAVGKEDEIKPFMERNATETHFTWVGFGSPKVEADWIIPDNFTLFALRDKELEVLNREECKQYYYGSPMLDRDGLNDDTMFCAGQLKTGAAPCDYDWGGAIQVMDDRHFCMWQIFGVYPRDEPHGDCTRARRPAVFNSIFPELDWIENIVFRDLAVENINVGTPECTLPEAYRSDVNMQRC